MRILVSGSHGLIGTALIERLEAEGHSVFRLLRGPAEPGSGDVSWDPAVGTLVPSAIEGFDGVVHLAGEGIGEKRWTDEQKAKILNSRVAGTKLLCEALAQLERKPSVLVSGSAVGYYGDRGTETITEDSGPGTGFLATVAQEWEAATAPAEAAGIRVVHVRTGIVLSAKGGALKETLPIFKLGLGGRLGSGRQYWSWVSIVDEVGAIIHALTNDSVRGPLNATAPNPVTNAEFTKAMGRALGRPAFLVVPKQALALRFGKEMVEEMMIGGQKVLPAKLEATGYKFAAPTIDTALEAALS